MVATKLKKSVGGVPDVDLRNLWYAPHRRIRTAGAAREAVRVAETVAGRRPMESPPDEQALFVALHTCAFKATRPGWPRRRQGEPGKSKGMAGHERRVWVERWAAIRGHIVEQNLGLVFSMIGRFGSRQIDEDDLLSEAMYALTRAVDRFNPWRGFKFSTYACNVIARALMRRGKQESHHRQVFPVQHDVLFEQASGMEDAGAGLYVERLRTILDRNLGQLTDLESQILAHRFTAERESRLTFQEIGDEVGLSKERVRQIQNVALSKLRELLVADPVLQ